MTQIISSTDSWEYVTSLYYEWNVIRGYQRYRWTIWVRDDHDRGPHFEYPWSESVPSIGLLPCAPCHPHGRSLERGLF
jgi:hypothetical protein